MPTSRRRPAKVIDKATAAQWRKIEQIRRQWIDRQTEQISHKACLQTVHAMWHAMGKEPPIVLQVPGPLALAVVHSQLRSQLDSQLRSQLYSQLSSQLHSQLHSQLRSQLRSQLYSQLHSQLYSQLHSQLRSQLYSQLYSQLDSQLHSQLRSQLRSQLYSQLDSQLRSQLRSELDSQLYSQLYSQLSSQLHSQLHSQLRSQLRSELDSQLDFSIWWGSWAGWYEGGKTLGVEFDEDRYKLFRQWCMSCPLVWPGEKVVLVCQNPTAIHWQSGLLHNESGPSVEYADGFKIYTIGGIPVDEQIVMKPETQTVQQIDKEGNADKKSIRIRRYGWPRYLREIKAQELDSRHNDLEGTEEALFILPDGETKLMATCPTGRPFVIGVGDEPNQIKTCDEAQKWIHRGRVMLART